MTNTPTTRQTGMYCRQCGYALRGLSEPRCPECGRPYNPTDPKSYLHHPRGWSLRRRARRAAWSLALLAVAFAVYAAVLWGYMRYHYLPGRQAETPHIAALTQRGCTVSVRETGEWARDLGEPFGWGYMTQRALMVIQGPQALSEADLKHLAELHHLGELRLDPERIDLAGLAHIAGLESLYSLEIGGRTKTNVPTKLDGALPHLAKLTNLRFLYLGHSDVSDGGMRHLAGLTNLEMLMLGMTRIGDAGLANLQGMTRLQHLYLDDTAVQGPGLANLAGMSSLVRLDLSRTAVDDQGLAHLRTLPNLVELRLDRTRVTDAGLAHLQAMPRLGSVTLAGTSVTAQGIEQLRKAKPRMLIHSNVVPPTDAP